MRAVFVLCACVWGAVGQDINSMRTMPKYDSRYDYLDVDAILDSKRLVRNYVDCLIAIKPCTPEGKALKTNNHPLLDKGLYQGAPQHSVFGLPHPTTTVSYI
ncbi:unnamed protein product [Plutella xylostella]|uniref:(diamondback moth) hypothetical protein n=1 Tax=Plutella xylostella TaxID=51655 RepID=A0A8S4FZ98_PLUXY|nr:unnamed protein product [Plutella xylostella]